MQAEVVIRNGFHDVTLRRKIDVELRGVTECEEPRICILDAGQLEDMRTCVGGPCDCGPWINVSIWVPGFSMPAVIVRHEPTARQMRDDQ